MLTLAPQTLGSRLRSEREIRGFTLEHISASTKIPVPLLEALERDDLSRWPKGIYRRAFFRAYVTALGLPPDPLTHEFARLFPDDTSPEPRAAAAAPSPPANAPSEPVAPAAPAHSLWRRIVVALLEVAAVVGVGSLTAWTAGMSLLTGSGAVALVYYPVMRAMSGRIRRVSRVKSAGATPAAPLSLTLAGPRTRLATARRRLGHLHAYLDARWRPRAGRIVRHTSHALRRAATRTGDTLGHGANVAGRASRIVISRTSIVRRHIGTTLRHTGIALRQTGIVLGRAGIAATGAARHVGRYTGIALARAGSGVARAAGYVARHTGRVSSRALDAANQAFWRLVRVAAEHAQLLAARQLNRTRE